MATFKGTNLNETVTPDLVSASVAASPPGSKPSIGVDTIYGNGGDDTINGVGGADTLYGGDGNDTVRHRTFWDDYVDGNVTFTGTASFHGGTGNDTLGSFFDGAGLNFDAMTYRMYGGAGDDLLEATYYYPDSQSTNYGAAHDYLYGGTGNDSYTVRESTDVVSEKAGEGYDLVHSWGTDYTLPANVEELRMDYVEWDTGSGFKGIGNALDNVIVGSTSKDSLYGGGGTIRSTDIPPEPMVKATTLTRSTAALATIRSTAAAAIPTPGMKPTPSTATLATTRSSASSATTRSMAASATTSSGVSPDTTRSTAAPATTGSAAAPVSTPSMARTATISCPEPGMPTV